MNHTCTTSITKSTKNNPKKKTGHFKQKNTNGSSFTVGRYGKSWEIQNKARIVPLVHPRTYTGISRAEKRNIASSIILAAVIIAIHAALK